MILLDTCTLLWLGLAPEQLSPQARTVLESPTERFYVSAISGFEIGQKHALGKLELRLPPDLWVPQALESHRLEELPLTIPIALRAAALPRLHPDPFDRLLIATALEHRLTLLTPDPKIKAYPRLKTLW